MVPVISSSAIVTLYTSNASLICSTKNSSSCSIVSWHKAHYEGNKSSTIVNLNTTSTTHM